MIKELYWLKYSFKKELFLIGMASLFIFSSAVFGFVGQDTKIHIQTNKPTLVTDISTQIKTELTPNNQTELVLLAPLQIDIKGHLPIVLVPVQEGLTEVKLNPPSYKEAIHSYGQLEMSLNLSQLMINIQSIQKQIQKKQLTQAMDAINELQTQYPDLPFFNFIRGSILFLQGKKSEAIESVKKAMEAHPDYEEGKTFLRSLGETPQKGEKNE